VVGALDLDHEMKALEPTATANYNGNGNGAGRMFKPRGEHRYRFLITQGRPAAFLRGYATSGA
jgi:hypothetical protein